MLDAAACGLPIVANHTMTARERIEGNGSFYRLNDREDLVQVLLGFREPHTRQNLGTFGAQKMARHFSWEAVAKRRLADAEIEISRRAVYTIAGSPANLSVSRTLL